MLVLGIETTCDETAVAIVTDKPQKHGKILANEIMSQIVKHAPYGGVVPEIAARAHLETIDGLIEQALKHAQISIKEIDAIAAAAGPGLIGGILVGLTTAKTLSLALNKPFIAVNHLEAHALTARLVSDISFPYLLLLISGGHTQLIAIRNINDYVLLGSTIDDALGEAFDKVARILGLSYPGGPEIEKYALKGNYLRFPLPKPMQGHTKPNFSFSGLKTAARLTVEKIKPISQQDTYDLAASFQATVIDILIERTQVGIKEFYNQVGLYPEKIVVAGGVAANLEIQYNIEKFCRRIGVQFTCPTPELCVDNGAMIAWAGIEKLNHNITHDINFSAKPRWNIGT